MEIKLKGRAIPRNAEGDAHFVVCDVSEDDALKYVLDVFTPDEVVELVNRALYQLEYQLAAHRKYGARKRAEEKALRDALKAKGVDTKKAQVDRELKGE